MLFRSCVTENNLVQQYAGEAPFDWRCANVTPIYKKGKKNLASNYRPVSLTSQIGKVMEAIIKDDLMGHLKQHNLIRNSQHGFWSGRSCLTNLLKFLEDVTKDADNGSPVDIIYLDFSKAFDKVPHARLIKKLEAHGIDSKVKTWISEWLNNRKQRVVISGTSSDWTHVKSGVLQGSVLGPVLFTIYINDIDKDVVCKVLKLLTTPKCIVRLLPTKMQNYYKNSYETCTNGA